MPDGDILVNDLVVECYGCREAKEHFPNVSLSSDPTEQWDGLSRLLEPKGWAVIGEVGNRHAYCPQCAIAAADPTQNLPPFNHKARCTMCGHNRVKTVYDSGLLPQSKYRQPHLVRTCERCGFRWDEGPASESAEKP